MNDFGIYIHLPFCKVRCTYCPFAVSTDDSLQTGYFDALTSEIQRRRIPPARVGTLYLGGGTPSRSAVENIGHVVSSLRDRFDMDGLTEFTMEANPEDVSPAALESWRRLGVNRISLGVQSFHDDELRPLGRVHGRYGAIEALTLTLSYGFRTNLDLILGLPGQTVESFHETLDIATSLGTGHISLYLLDLEEGTKLRSQVSEGTVALPEEEDVVELYGEAVEALRSRGLMQYEVSNFARPGEECAHNLGYWRRGEYVGYGLGAHSFYEESRQANTREIAEYIRLATAEGNAVTFRESLGNAERTHERILLTLRQNVGMDESELLALRGEEAREWTRIGLAEGWLQRKEGRVALTPAGFLLSNEYISRLF